MIFFTIKIRIIKRRAIRINILMLNPESEADRIDESELNKKLFVWVKVELIKESPILR